MPASRPLVAIAIVGPVILAIGFVPLFRRVQQRGVPAGSLEGIDMTPFALRDERMMLAFACLLIVFVVGVTLAARSRRGKLGVAVAGLLSAALSYIGVFASLLAG